MAQIRSNIGSYLRKVREKKQIPLDQAIAELSLLGVNYSKSALSRLERELIPVRADVVAGLSIIYKTKIDKIMFNK